jgi:hypothetical protein
MPRDHCGAFTPFVAASMLIKRRMCRSICSAGLLCFFIASPTQAQPILNGDFESPAIVDGTYETTTPSSWVGNGLLMNPDATGNFSGDPGTWPQAQSGQQYQDIGNTPDFSISQSFSVSVPALFQISWYDNTALQLAPATSSPYTILLTDSSGQPVFSANLDSFHNGIWQFNSATQALAADLYTLSFRSQNLPRSADTLIDNVAVVQIPEPNAWVLLLPIVMAVCLLRR